MSATTMILSVIVVLVTALPATARAEEENANVKVGLVFDLSGKREPALDVIKGIKYAVKELNSTSKRIELIKFDSGSDALGTKAAMKKVLKSPPDVIIAEIDSSKAVVAAAAAEQAGRVMITPYATSPAVTNGRKYVFRTCFADDFQGARLARFAKENLAAKNVAIFSDGGQLYSQTLATAFRDEFKKIGGSIVRDEKILSSSQSFKEQIDAAKDVKADVIFLPLYEQPAARFINESVIRGTNNVTFLGGDGWGATRTFQDIIFRKDKPVGAYWVSHYSGDFEDEALKQVASRYRAKMHEDLNASSAIGYDAMMVIAKALTRLNNRDFKQDELANALRSMPAYTGVTGTIHYDGGQDPQKSLFLRQVKNGKMKIKGELKP